MSGLYALPLLARIFPYLQCCFPLSEPLNGEHCFQLIFIRLPLNSVLGEPPKQATYAPLSLKIVSMALDAFEASGQERALFPDVDPNPTQENLTAGVVAVRAGERDSVRRWLMASESLVAEEGLEPPTQGL